MNKSDKTQMLEECWGSLTAYECQLPFQKLTKSEYTIGRDKKCDIYLSNATISHQHCTISFDRDSKTCWIKNLSPNSIYIGDKKLSKDEEAKLLPADIIKLPGSKKNPLSYIFSQAQPINPLKRFPDRPQSSFENLILQKRLKPAMQIQSSKGDDKDPQSYENLKKKFKSLWDRLPYKVNFEEEEKKKQGPFKSYQAEWKKFKDLPEVKAVSESLDKKEILCVTFRDIVQLIISPEKMKYNFEKLKILRKVDWPKVFEVLEIIEGRNDAEAVFVRGILINLDFLKFEGERHVDKFLKFYKDFIENLKDIKTLGNFKTFSKVTERAFLLIEKIFSDSEASKNLATVFKNLDFHKNNPDVKIEDKQIIDDLKELIPTKAIQYMENDDIPSLTIFGIVGFSRSVVQNKDILFAEQRQAALLVVLLLNETSYLYQLKHSSELDPPANMLENIRYIEGQLYGEKTRFLIPKMSTETAERILDYKSWRKPKFLEDLGQVSNLNPIQGSGKNAPLGFLLNADPNDVLSCPQVVTSEEKKEIVQALKD